MEDYRLSAKTPVDFLLPTFALNKVEDAVHLLSLNEDCMWIEKSHQEFTQKHKIIKSTKELKET